MLVCKTTERRLVMAVVGDEIEVAVLIETFGKY
jgi:hypothetical protein